MAVGVSPLTVYRWELDDGAPEARRPRGAIAARLREMGLRSVGQTEHGDAPASTRLETDDARSFVSVAGQARLDGVFEALRRADFRAAETMLLDELSAGSLRTPSARALAAYAQGMALLFGRNDAHGALGLLLPYLADADRYEPEVALRLHVLAAHVFASSDGRLFDLGRVRTHVARAESHVAETASADLRFLVRHAEVLAAVLSSDAGLVQHTLARCERYFRHVRDPFTRALVLELEGHAATFAGDVEGSCRAYRESIRSAEPLAFAYAHVRASAFLALHECDRGAAPGEVLARVSEARNWSIRAGLRPGVHSLYLAAVEGDALLRQGELDRAEAVLREGLALAADLAWSPIPIGLIFANLLVARGNFDELRAFGEALTQSEYRVQRALTRAYGRFLLACADLWSDTNRLASAKGFLAVVDEVRAAGGWPFLEREALVRAHTAAVAAGADVEAAESLRAAKRLLELHPARRTRTWLTRTRAVASLRRGDADDALGLLGDARTAFAAMGDVPEVLLTERVMAFASRMLGLEGAAELVKASEEAFAALGLVAPRVFEPARIEEAAERAARRPHGPNRLRALKEAVEALLHRGFASEDLEEELLHAVRRLVPEARWFVRDAGASQHEGERAWRLRSPAGRTERVVVAESSIDRDAELAVDVLFVAAEAMVAPCNERPGTIAPAAGAVPEAPDDGADGFIAASPLMRSLRAEIRALGASKATVIIHGESGSGKELVARAVHDGSARSGKPFVTLNCAAVPRELFESQLFGHKKGAFTGANADALGVLRAADGGTVFLDEIGELPLDVQPKLLRFLENAEVLPVGANRPQTVDVRVVAATHRDLLKRVAEGAFREDLYYRLQVIPIAVPPLRERPEDTVAIARAFLARHARDGESVTALSPDAIARLVAYPWPGNVRELRNVIDRAMAFEPRPSTLRAEHLRLGRG